MNDAPDPLDQRIEQYYKQKKLPLDTLFDLRETIEQSTTTQKEKVGWLSTLMPSHLMPSHLTPSQPVQPWLKPTVAFAALLLCIGLTFFMTQWQTNQQQMEAVAAEIALNHAKQFDAEFVTPHIAGLTSQMHLLDFAPVHPRRMQLGSYHVLGARYCTIDSSIAVQVHLEDDAQTAYTLYQFRTPGSFDVAQETVLDVGEIQVTLWREGDVTMGLAHRTH